MISIIISILFVSFSTFCYAQKCLTDEDELCSIETEVTFVEFLKFDKVAQSGASPFSYVIGEADRPLPNNLQHYFEVYVQTISEFDSSSSTIKKTLGFPRTPSWKINLTPTEANFNLINSTDTSQLCTGEKANIELCYDLNVEYKLLTKDENIQINNNNVPLKNGTLIVKKTISGWDFESNSNILNVLYEFAPASRLGGSFRGVDIGNDKKTNKTMIESKSTTEFRINLSKTSIDVVFYPHSNQKIILKPKEYQLNYQIPYFGESVSYTYTIMPVVDGTTLNEPTLSSSEMETGRDILIGVSVAIAIVVLLAIVLLYCKLRRGKKNRRVC